MPFHFLSEHVDHSNFSWTEEDINSFEKEFEIISGFLHSSVNNDTFQELFNHCYYLVDKIPLPMFHLNVSFLVRARPNYNGEIFTEESDISYNTKNVKKIKANRFNRPEESMFYGTLKADSGKGDFIPTATLESCKELLDNTNTSRYQYLTFGKWHLKEDFHVVNLCFHDDIMSHNPMLKKYIDLYFEEMQKVFPASSVALIKRFLKFFSDMASAKHPTNAHYFISTAFFCALKEYYKRTDNTEIHGIIYPSCMTEYHGVNIVLTPEAVHRFLYLEEAFMYRYTRDPKNPTIYYSNVVSNIAKNIEGKFQFSYVE